MQRYFISARCDEDNPPRNVSATLSAENVLEAFKCLAALIIKDHYSEHGDFDIDVDFFLKSNFADTHDVTPPDNAAGVWVWLPNDDDIWQEVIIYLGEATA